MSDAYFHGVWRMDWGLGNTNKTAVLIAMLMIGIWALSSIKKWGFNVALILFVGLGICLVHTVSRGGLLAASTGLSAVLWFVPRPWEWKKSAAIIAGILIIIASSLYLRTYERYSEGITDEDPSINNRLSLWRTAPRMMVDAPLGWGIGNSGDAYMLWYQPLDRHEKYRTLVNSHLTWLVEFGWPLRFAYIVAWLSILVLTFPIKNRSWMAIPFGIWIAFFIGSFFSSVAESVYLWIVPVCSLSFVIYTRWQCAQGIKLSKMMAVVGIAALVVMILFITGLSAAQPRIQVSGNEITVGGNQPATWILVDPQTLGSDFGRILRRALPPDAIGFIFSDRMPTNLTGNTLVICGTIKQQQLQKISLISANFRKLLLLNPSFYPQELSVKSSVEINVVFGEFSRSSSVNEWRSQSGSPVSILRGIGDFMPKWPTLLKE